MSKFGMVLWADFQNSIFTHDNFPSLSNADTADVDRAKTGVLSRTKPEPCCPSDPQIKMVDRIISNHPVTQPGAQGDGAREASDVASTAWVGPSAPVDVYAHALSERCGRSGKKSAPIPDMDWGVRNFTSGTETDTMMSSCRASFHAVNSITTILRTPPFLVSTCAGRTDANIYATMRTFVWPRNAG